MDKIGLVSGSSGNLSVRVASEEPGGLVAITPRGKPYRDLSDEDVVVVDFEAEPVEGELPPSAETMLHVGIYSARPDVRSVVHTHSVFSSVAAVAGMAIPPIIDEMVVTLGGGIEVSEYAFPGSEDLAENVAAALGERAAVLMRNHGAVGVGRDSRAALDVCILVERVAQIFIYSSLLGRAHTLPPDVVEAEQAFYRMRQQALGVGE